MFEIGILNFEHFNNHNFVGIQEGIGFVDESLSLRDIWHWCPSVGFWSLANDPDWSSHPEGVGDLVQFTSPLPGIP